MASRKECSCLCAARASVQSPFPGGRVVCGLERDGRTAAECSMPLLDFLDMIEGPIRQTQLL